MNPAITVTQKQLTEILLNVAVVRPVFIWGQPGIGQSSLVQEFAAQVGLPCVLLLRSQLAPEDLIGVPQIVDGTSRFCPPTMIAREKPYCLFLDELNACTHEVQKAFYSLIHERRIGEYMLPKGSIVIGAGNRAQDSAIVMAHELLHVGLRHDVRCGGRDPYLWNVACDYVINGWLVEMGLGELPRVGTLYDPDLKGESAEGIYDRIVTDLRRYRKLATLRGVELGDMLGTPGWWAVGDGVDLDEFYRNCLCQGLLLHEEQCRGYISAGLIEEIRALSQPPIPWDVELAQWFDNYFAPLEKIRTYARLSRRQSATPDIPRPRWVPAPGADDGRTFGVLLDTSGSMDRTLLAKALGAIASYSISRDVPAVRVVFCDAAAYDQGYMLPEAIAEHVKVRGRGGTILQPGIDLLEHADDFPKDGPLLIITDGMCDRLHIRRDHAFLMPENRSLPFVPKGKVFRIR